MSSSLNSEHVHDVRDDPLASHRAHLAPPHAWAPVPNSRFPSTLSRSTMAMFAVAAILPSLAVNPVATLSTSLGDIKVELSSP